MSERIAREVTVIEVAKERPPIISRIAENGALCLKIGPSTYLQGNPAALREWFAEAGLVLADEFFDDLEAGIKRDEKFAAERFPAKQDYDLIG